jgi:hypothetical protein
MSICGGAERLILKDTNSNHNSEEIMKFICLGYMDERTWDAMAERDRTTLIN